MAPEASTPASSLAAAFSADRCELASRAAAAGLGPTLGVVLPWAAGCMARPELRAAWRSWLPVLLPALLAAAWLATHGRTGLLLWSRLARLREAGLEDSASSWFASKGAPAPVAPVLPLLPLVPLFLILAYQAVGLRGGIGTVGVYALALGLPLSLRGAGLLLERLAAGVVRLERLRIHINTLRLPRPRDVPDHWLPAGLDAEPAPRPAGALLWLAGGLLGGTGLGLCAAAMFQQLAGGFEVAVLAPYAAGGLLLLCLAALPLCAEPVLVGLERRERALCSAAMGLDVEAFSRPALERLAGLAALLPWLGDLCLLAVCAGALPLAGLWGPAPLAGWLLAAFCWRSLRPAFALPHQHAALAAALSEAQDRLLARLEQRQAG